MTPTFAFLVLTGAFASAVGMSRNLPAATRFVRDAAFVAVGILFLGIALWVVFPDGTWFFPAALSLCGAACVAHGLAIMKKLQLLTGFMFSIMGGFQLGIVLLQALQVR